MPKFRTMRVDTHAGEGICEISVEDNPGGASERIHVDGNIKTYRIKSGAKHTVYNIGEKEFYLIAFFSSI